MLNKEELLNIKGGGFSSTMLNAIARTINTILEVGRTFGSSLRRMFDKKTCRY